MEEFFEPAVEEEFGLWDDTGEEATLMLRYDTDDPEFSRGFQCGMIWQLLHGGVNEFEIPVYLTNAEMVMRMAEAAGYTYTARYENESELEGDADWILIKFVDPGSTE
jgi:hypothetical protein